MYQSKNHHAFTTISMHGKKKHAREDGVVACLVLVGVELGGRRNRVRALSFALSLSATPSLDTMSDVWVGACTPGSADSAGSEASQA